MYAIVKLTIIYHLDAAFGTSRVTRAYYSEKLSNKYE